MKVLTIQQPWASLIMLGTKTIETRSWDTKYRGPLLIHAAAGMPRLNMELCSKEPFKRYVSEWYMLPLGKILGKVMLSETCSSAYLKKCFRFNPEWFLPYEQSFGDYSPNRYGWELTDVEVFKTPIPAKGQLGLWNFPDKKLLEYGIR